MAHMLVVQGGLLGSGDLLREPLSGILQLLRQGSVNFEEEP